MSHKYQALNSCNRSKDAAKNRACVLPTEDSEELNVESKLCDPHRAAKVRLTMRPNFGGFCRTNKSRTCVYIL